MLSTFITLFIRIRISPIYTLGRKISPHFHQVLSWASRINCIIINSKLAFYVIQFLTLFFHQALKILITIMRILILPSNHKNLALIARYCKLCTYLQMVVNLTLKIPLLLLQITFIRTCIFWKLTLFYMFNNIIIIISFLTFIILTFEL